MGQLCWLFHMDTGHAMVLYLLFEVLFTLTSTQKWELRRCSEKKILFIVTPCSIQHFPCLFVVCDLFSSIRWQTTSSPLVYHGSAGNVTDCLFLPVICDYILIPNVLLLEDEHKTKCHSVIDYYAAVYFLYFEPIELKWEINLHSSDQWTIFCDDLLRRQYTSPSAYQSRVINLRVIFWWQQGYNFQ